MRNLTIKRHKSAAASMVKMRIYIEDPESNELKINGVACRKIGELKNGEEKTFSIPSTPVKVYAIADKLSKDYCNDYYPIPAGNEDVYISGKNHYKPFSGNPFLFDGVTDHAALANRKSTKGKNRIVMIVAVILGIVIGLFNAGVFDGASAPKAKEFSYGGMTITLNDSFSRENYEGYTVCYESRNVAVFALEESFATIPGAELYSLEEYGNLVIRANGREGQSVLQSQDGVTWFEYTWTNPSSGQTFFYFSTVHKADDAFWLVQFATTQDQAAEYRILFMQWAKSISFQ